LDWRNHDVSQLTVVPIANLQITSSHLTHVHSQDVLFHFQQSTWSSALGWWTSTWRVGLPQSFHQIPSCRYHPHWEERCEMLCRESHKRVPFLTFQNRTDSFSISSMQLKMMVWCFVNANKQNSSPLIISHSGFRLFPEIHWMNSRSIKSHWSPPYCRLKQFLLFIDYIHSKCLILLSSHNVIQHVFESFFFGTKCC
jgi:hypothetical protein